jgi:hypothetical protein
MKIEKKSKEEFVGDLFFLVFTLTVITNGPQNTESVNFVSSHLY